jgi:hypothetical protein
MAFNKNGLRCLTFPSSIAELSVRSYVTTTDTIANVIVANYFVGAGILRNGDLMLLKASDGSALLQIDTLTADANETVSAVTVKKFSTA